MPFFIIAFWPAHIRCCHRGCFWCLLFPFLSVLQPSKPPRVCILFSLTVGNRLCQQDTKAGHIFFVQSSVLARNGPPPPLIPSPFRADRVPSLLHALLFLSPPVNLEYFSTQHTHATLALCRPAFVLFLMDRADSLDQRQILGFSLLSRHVTKLFLERQISFNVTSQNHRHHVGLFIFLNRSICRSLNLYIWFIFPLQAPCFRSTLLPMMSCVTRLSFHLLASACPSDP